MMIIALIVNGGLGFVIGELFTIFLARFFLDNLQTGSWRAFLITISTVVLFVLLGVYYILEDSPRHLL